MQSFDWLTWWRALGIGPEPGAGCMEPCKLVASIHRLPLPARSRRLHAPFDLGMALFAAAMAWGAVATWEQVAWGAISLIW
jgi:hypothetical protein